MTKVVVDKKNDKVLLEMSIEQAFSVLSNISFSKNVVDYDTYEKLYEKLNCPRFNFNASYDDVDKAIKEQKELVNKFKLTTFSDVMGGQMFKVAKNCFGNISYIKSHYPDDNSNCYFIKDGSLIHAKIEQNTEVEILGDGKFSVTLK